MYQIQQRQWWGKELWEAPFFRDKKPLVFESKEEAMAELKICVEGPITPEELRQNYRVVVVTQSDLEKQESRLPVLSKLWLGKKVDDKEVEDALTEVCEDTHSVCDDSCPVYECNRYSSVSSDGPLRCGNTVEDVVRLLKTPRKATGARECMCRKNGKAMLAFLRANGLNNES